MSVEAQAAQVAGQMQEQMLQQQKPTAPTDPSQESVQQFELALQGEMQAAQKADAAAASNLQTSVTSAENVASSTPGDALLESLKKMGVGDNNAALENIFTNLDSIHSAGGTLDTQALISMQFEMTKFALMNQITMEIGKNLESQGDRLMHQSG